MMKKAAFTILLLVSLIACSKENAQPAAPETTDFIKGADISFLPEIEEYGTTFYDANGQANDVLSILKNNGFNTIRLRLWYEPKNEHSGLAEVSAFAKRIKAQGLKVWLDFHYADSWADPGKQPTPKSWQSLDYNTLTDSVYIYTKRVLNIIQPEYVQIGNEINGGMLWETGRINNQNNFIGLLKRGIQATRDNNPNTKIIIHFAGIDGAEWFYNLLEANKVDYDIIGLSYYPLWHGKSFDNLKTTMSTLAYDHNKPVLIAETAYPFTLDSNDYTGNILGQTDQLYPGYDATPEGQRQFLLDLITTIQKAHNGLGICYWAPEWVAFKGKTATDGSAWENEALFDFGNKALPALEVFKE